MPINLDNYQIFKTFINSSPKILEETIQKCMEEMKKEHFFVEHISSSTGVDVDGVNYEAVHLIFKNRFFKLS